jgi:ribosomal protein S4
MYTKPTAEELQKARTARRQYAKTALAFTKAYNRDKEIRRRAIRAEHVLQVRTARRMFLSKMQDLLASMDSYLDEARRMSTPVTDGLTT